jgi:hypothetical protein
MKHQLQKAVLVVVGLSTFTAISTFSDTIALGNQTKNFALCGICKGANHYVGFSRQNNARLGTAQESIPAQVLRTFPGLSDAKEMLTAKGRTTVRVEQENGNFVISEHRLETLRIGNLRKSETMIAQVTDQIGSAEARVQLVWGDTISIRSKTVARGTPVTLTLNRTMGGFGNPATQGAYYNAQSETYIDGVAIIDLAFGLKRYPGEGQKDQATGKDKLDYKIQAKVGQTIRLEGSLAVSDGVKSALKSQQILNGADSVAYTIAIDNPDACGQSSSGQMNAGTCKP